MKTPKELWVSYTYLFIDKLYNIHTKFSSDSVGQFFRRGVKIDVHRKLLHIPGRRNPAVVQEQPLWKFMQQKFHSDTKCWTSAYHSSQGVGIVEGSYKDYIVDGLLAVTDG